MNWGTFRADKALEVLLYILSKGCANMYNMLKVVYFADKAHMKMTGTTIFKDRYIAMKNGPVPSGTYDLLKAVIDAGSSCRFNDYHLLVQDAITYEDGKAHFFKALRGPNLKVFSKADRVALDEAIEKYGHMSFSELKEISHEGIDYLQADENDVMSFDYFLQSVDEDGNIRIFLEECMEEVVC